MRRPSGPPGWPPPRRRPARSPRRWSRRPGRRRTLAGLAAGLHDSSLDSCDLADDLLLGRRCGRWRRSRPAGWTPRSRSPRCGRASPSGAARVLVISWRAVALTMSSARVAGSMRSMTVVTPRRAMPDGLAGALARAGQALVDALRGGRVGRRPRRGRGRFLDLGLGRLGRFLGPLDEAHRRAPSCAASAPTVDRREHSEARVRATTTMWRRCRPARPCPTTTCTPAWACRRRQPRGHRGRLARPAAQAPPGRRRRRRPRAWPSASTSPTTG